MKHFDEKVTDELRDIRNKFVNERWEQLYNLSKESSESAIKYLFTTNAGGGVAVLTYLGAIVDKGVPHVNAKVSLGLFFIGIIFVGIYKAYIVHFHEGLMNNYKNLVNDYYDSKIGWNSLLESDESNVGSSKVPYILAYISFGCFIVGSAIGSYGIF